VCLSAMSSQIYRCRGNAPRNDANNTRSKSICHNICAKCEWTMRRMKEENGKFKPMQCPICKVKGDFVRNKALEQQLHALSTPCKHAAAGCTQRFFPWDDNRKMHEDYLCPFQPVDCPFCYQSIPGGRANFIEHLMKSTMSRNGDHRRNDSNSPSIIEMDSSSDPVVDENELAQALEAHNSMDWNSGNEQNQQMMNDTLASAEYLDEEPSPQNVVNVQLQRRRSSNRSNRMQQPPQSQSVPRDSSNEMDLVEEDEDEEKECPHSVHHHGPHSNRCCNSNGQEIPGCLLQFHRSEDCPDLGQLGEWVIRRDRNEYIVCYALGVVVCAIAPRDDYPCWRVSVISIDPRHGIKGNSRVYLQHFDYDLMRQYQEKEDQCALSMSYLSRPITSTVMMAMARLHPSVLRQRFNSYPMDNPFLKRISWTKTRKSLLDPIPSEIKENECDDAEMDDSTKGISSRPRNAFHRRQSVNLQQKSSTNHSNIQSDSKRTNDIQHDRHMNHHQMDQDDDDDDLESETPSEIDEHEPQLFSGQSPCTAIQCVPICAGMACGGQRGIQKLCIRLFALEESFKVGAVIDARDFTGDWFEAEILAVQDSEGNVFKAIESGRDECLDIRRCKVHYLGYSASYDEWLDVDMDSQRIAQRGTFTIGPSLRAIRKNSANLRNQRLVMRHREARQEDAEHPAVAE